MNIVQQPYKTSFWGFIDPAHVPNHVTGSVNVGEKLDAMCELLQKVATGTCQVSEEYNDLIDGEVCHYLSAYVNGNQHIIGELFRPEQYNRLVCKIDDVREQQGCDTHNECFDLALKSIAVAQKAYVTDQELRQQISSLQSKLENKKLQTTSTSAQVSMTHVNYDMDPYVMQYVIRYGMPEKGIFDAKKYVALRKELEQTPPDQWDWTVRYCPPSPSSSSCSSSDNESDCDCNDTGVSDLPSGVSDAPTCVSDLPTGV